MLKTAAVFSDHMVLQQEKPIPVWGWSEPGAVVTAELSEESRSVHADEEGAWCVAFRPRAAARGLSMTIRKGDELIRFSDLSVGEVYLAGGQSNMELRLEESLNGAEAIAGSGCPDIRFYMVPKCAAEDEELERAEAASGWKVCGPDTSAEMSAVAYYFARHLVSDLSVPVGILCCAWGGTSISCWMSREQLMKTTAGARYIENYDRLIGDKSDETYRAEMEAYNQEWEAWNARVEARRRVDPDVTWEVLNEECGLCPWPQPAGRTSPFRPAGLYGTMLRRVCPYAIRGFLYYQGEEDEARCEDYDWMMISLITEWRTAWGDPHIPFLFVQLPMYIAKADAVKGFDSRHWPVLRDQQMKTVRTVSHTGLAVLADCGEFDNIHPLDKETVGARLALQARQKVYGEEICADAPVCDRVTFQDGKARLHFHHTGGWLCVKGDGPQTFELAGRDGRFFEAEGLVETDTVILWAGQVPEPLFVRYAWRSYCKPNLYGASGLPAAPFRTDSFPLEEV